MFAGAIGGVSAVWGRDGCLPYALGTPKHDQMRVTRRHLWVGRYIIWLIFATLDRAYCARKPCLFQAVMIVPVDRYVAR